MAKFAVILAAAGRSTRFQSNQRKKPFVELKGRAVWLRAAELFVGRKDVVQTLVAVAPDDLDWFKDKFRPNLAFMDVELVAGGRERADTVEKALARVRADVDFVAVHDAARPLLAAEWIDKLFEAAERTGAVIPALPVTSTVKRVAGDGSIVETVPREGLWLAQTPQVFRRQLLLDAYARRGNTPATDEASLVEQLGHAVSVMEGWPMNIKITSRDDFRMAEALLDALPRPKLRSLHPFEDERFL
ncbi:MAG TPA: 2-C-methyl-D-erythritol 4-phosphate cytidylyltransferase [Planctomycetaceae bacterium]|nr:2-C-methyl-D-erythritol 4-phosphate cytidylyltransferase [Planctomycetaceae bacterium]